MVGCSKDEPPVTIEKATEDTSTVAKETTTSETKPDPEPEPEPEPPSPWKRVEVSGKLSIEVNENWICVEGDDRTRYYFEEGSLLPIFAFYDDQVRGFSGDTDAGFDEFFEWWLAERFHNQGLDVTSEEFVTNNGVRGLEIVYYSTDSDTGVDVSRHCIYTIIEQTYIAMTFNFEVDGEAPYLDDVRHVFESIHRIDIDMYEWPSMYLPKDTPEYSDGELRAYIAFNAVNLYINNTTKEILSEYIDSLIKEGWELELIYPEQPTWEGTRDSWRFHGRMQDDGTSAAIFFFYPE